jgi:hypothetical protein
MLQRAAELDDKADQPEYGEIRLVINQHGRTHEGDWHLLHRPFHQLPDRGVAAFSPGLARISD